MKNKNEICLILPYFGRFPNYFDKWLLSAKKNTFIDFYIITDSEMSRSDENIHYVNMTLKDIKERVEACVGYKIRLESPYKLCDYKPTYGEVFSDITTEYNWWGYIDPDIVFGDMRLLFSVENLNSYDTIGGGGWCTLIRNDDRFNYAYKREFSDIKAFSLREASKTNNSMIVDEWNFRQTLKKVGARMMDFYNQTVNICADIIPFPSQKAMSVRFLDAPIYGKYSAGGGHSLRTATGMAYGMNAKTL